MLLHWIGFFAATVVTYIGIAFYGQITGGASHSAWQAVLAGFKPIPILVVIIANVFFALAIYWGFAVTRYAIPIALALGVIVTTVYSVFVLGVSLGTVKIAGVMFAALGVVLLSL